MLGTEQLRALERPSVERVLNAEESVEREVAEELVSLALEGCARAERTLELAPESGEALLWRATLLSIETFGRSIVGSPTGQHWRQCLLYSTAPVGVGPYASKLTWSRYGRRRHEAELELCIEALPSALVAPMDAATRRRLAPA